MQDIKSPKAAGVDKLSEKFLRDVAYILAKPIFALCDLVTYQSPEESFQVLEKLQN